LRAKTHQWIGEAISGQLRNLGDKVAGLVERAQELLEATGNVSPGATTLKEKNENW